MTDEQTGMNRRTILVLILLMAMSNLLPLWLVEFPALQDFPNHLARAKIISDYGRSSFAQQHFTINVSPIPNVISDLILISCLYVFPPLTAGKLILSLYLVLLPLSVFCFLSSVEGRNVFYAVIPVVWSYNWYFNMGFLNFCLGVTIYFLTVAMAMTYYREPTNLKLALLSIVTLILYFAHLFPFALYLVTLFLLLVFRDFTNWTKVQRIFLTCLPPVMLFLVHTQMESSHSNPVIFRSLQRKLPAMASMHVSFVPVIDLLLLGVTIVLYIWLFSLGIVRKSRSRGTWMFIWLSFVGLYFILPESAFGGWYVDVRILIFLMFIALLFLRELRGPSLRLAVLTVLLLQVIQVSVTTVSYRQFSGELQAAVHSMRSIPSNSFVLPIDTNMKKGRINPYLNAWAYCLLEKDSLFPYLFTGKGQHLLHYKTFLYAPDRFWVRDHVSIDWAKVFGQYDYIVIFGRHSRIENIVSERATLVNESHVTSLFKVNE